MFYTDDIFPPSTPFSDFVKILSDRWTPRDKTRGLVMEFAPRNPLANELAGVSYIGPYVLVWHAIARLNHQTLLHWVGFGWHHYYPYQSSP